MIEGFIEYTAHLTDYEREMVVPFLVEGLKKRVGSTYAVRNKTMCQELKARGFENISESKIRKCINFIRMNGLVPHLVASQRGYYVATSIEEVERYCESLKERAMAIFAMRQALEYQMNGKLFL